jgi:DNA-binding transcriptional LysR family regulator
MGRIDGFTGLAEFLAVAKYASFREAGAKLGVTASAVSQAIRSLEARVGLPLFQRTTRRVALTEAGAQLVIQLSPAATTINDAMESVRNLGQRATGTLRLSVPHIAVELALKRLLPPYRQVCPDVNLELDVDDSSVDLAACGCDAGIRIGEFIQRDMVAIPLTPDLRRVVVGAPGYFEAHGKPESPQELTEHECIRYRFPSARTVYRWEFSRKGKEFSLDPPGRTVVNDHLTMIELARSGLGLAYTADLVVAAALKSGALQECLSAHLPTKTGLFLYFPGRTQTQPKLRALIDIAKRSAA